VRKIAILGGGCGAIATAWALTSEPGWEEQFDITIYQLGWRLGGKGASGRSQRHFERIEEHGIHMWNGFYENAFMVMQEAYRECERDPRAPLATWRDAFKERNRVVYDEVVDGEHLKWALTFPKNDAVPGDGREYPRLYEYIVMALEWLLELFPGEVETEAGLVARGLRAICRLLGCRGHRGASDIDNAHLRAAHARADQVRDRPETFGEEALREIVEHLSAFVQHAVERWERRLEAGEVDAKKHAKMRRAILVAEVTLAGIHGILHDEVYRKGFAAIDHLDFRDWLRRNGASEAAVNMAPIKSLYDAMFAYKRGDPERPGISAGSTLHGALRLFLGYKGSLYYQMQAGMGDVVFGPFYTALRKRGVKFKFFHNITNLALASDRSCVEAITVREQARIKEGREYEPFRRVQGLDCWPDEPDWDQIEGGDALKGQDFELPSSPYVREYDLRKGVDFDLVVLGIPVGAHPMICTELMDASESWRKMAHNLDVVPTTGTQLWFKPDWADLGYPDPPTVGAGYNYPLSIWADTTELLPRGEWPKDATPGAICYLCGTFKWTETELPVIDLENQKRANEKAYRESVEWLKEGAGLVWPAGVRADHSEELGWELLYDGDDSRAERRRGEERMRSQYWRANVSPSELYVGSWHDTNQYRMKAGNSGFENLYLAGDWIDTGFNMGFVEAAVMSGMFCSRAIAGYPKRIIGEDDCI
jgi:uncharacterized protein with NAD-binding domain and iron-sulfur cluster